MFLFTALSLPPPNGSLQEVGDEDSIALDVSASRQAVLYSPVTPVVTSSNTTAVRQVMPLKERYALRNLPCFAQRVSLYTHAPTKIFDCSYLSLRSNLPLFAFPDGSLWEWQQTVSRP